MQQKETALQEVAELKIQLKIMEETRDAIKRDLMDANLNIREGLMPICTINSSDVVITSTDRFSTDRASSSDGVPTLMHFVLVWMCHAGEEQKEMLQKEITDLKRALSEEAYEKEAVQKAANDLRSMVKKTEADKVEIGRQLQDMKQRVNGSNLQNPDDP